MSTHQDMINLAGAAGCGGKAARVMEYMLAGEGPTTHTPPSCEL